MQCMTAPAAERSDTVTLFMLRLPSGRNLMSAALYRLHGSLALFLWCGRCPRRARVITLTGPARSHTGAGRWAW